MTRWMVGVHGKQKGSLAIGKVTYIQVKADDENLAKKLAVEKAKKENNMEEPINITSIKLLH